MFKKWKDRIYFFKEINSTMTFAKNLAQEECAHFSIVVAERQTKGKGRMDRKWISDDGGLYFNIILRPNLDIEKAFLINFSASFILAKILRNLGFDAFVKWPNDIYINEKKVAGILSELKLIDNKINFINLGIGLNVSNEPYLEEARSISLKKISNKNIDKKEILRDFLEEFESYINADNFNTQINETIKNWKKYAISFNRNVKVITYKEEINGKTLDVDDVGALVLETNEGIKRIVYGDCFLVN